MSSTKYSSKLLEDMRIIATFLEDSLKKKSYLFLNEQYMHVIKDSNDTQKTCTVKSHPLLLK